MDAQLPSPAAPVPLNYAEPALINPRVLIPIDWQFIALQIPHRISSAALFVFLIPIVSNVKDLGLPPMLPLAMLLASLGLGISLIIFLVLHAHQKNTLETTGLIFFSLFLIAGIITFRILTGIHLTPLPLLPF